MCVYLCALHSQKPQKLLARYFEDLLRCSFIFFFLNSRRTGKAKKGRELFFSSRGKEAHTVWYSGRQRGVASSQSLLMLWENINKKTQKTHGTEKPKSSRATCAFLSLLSASLSESLVCCSKKFGYNSHFPHRVYISRSLLLLLAHTGKEKRLISSPLRARVHINTHTHTRYINTSCLLAQSRRRRRRRCCRPLPRENLINRNHHQPSEDQRDERHLCEHLLLPRLKHTPLTRRRKK